MFQFDWSRFNTRLGLIFAAGVLVVFGLTGRLEFPLYTAGISALLAWITIILAPGPTRRQHITGLLAFLVGGAALIALADTVAAWPGGRLVSVALVTFGGYLVMLRGLHPFMVAWCLVYWYLLVPLFLKDQGVSNVILGHCVGTALVIALNLLQPVWSLATKRTAAEPNDSAPPGEDHPTLGFVFGFAVTVSVAMLVGVAAGARWLATDPTLIANATLNMISPSLQQTWHAAVERLVLGTAGLIAGFYFGWYFPQAWVGYGVALVCSFLALGLLYVNFALVLCVLFFLTAYFWGTMQSDLAHQLGNEKLIGEFAGVAIAVIAIAVLTRLRRNQQATDQGGN
jgi:hypothetical protein